MIEVKHYCDICKKEVSTLERFLDFSSLWFMPIHFLLFNIDLFICNECKNKLAKALDEEIEKIRGAKK